MLVIRRAAIALDTSVNPVEGFIKDNPQVVLNPANS